MGQRFDVKSFHEPAVPLIAAEFLIEHQPQSLSSLQLQLPCNTTFQPLQHSNMLCQRCTSLLRGSRLLAAPIRATRRNVANPTLLRRDASSSASIALTAPRFSLRQTTPPRIHSAQRSYSSTASPEASTSATESGPESGALEKPDFLDEAESLIWGRLVEEFDPVELVVQDISGGCGSMYGIEISSEKFRGANMLKQQRMVNAVLGDLMKGWHGVQLKTRVP